MQKTINEIWQIFLMIWTCRNGEKYGKDYDEQCEIALATSQDRVREIYKRTRNSISNQESALLHAHPLEEILTWMKPIWMHTLQLAGEVILEQNVNPG